MAKKKTKKDELRTVHLKFSEDEIKEIDNWREENRIRTRSEAIRQMIRQTLQASFAEVVSLGVGMREKDSGYSRPSLVKYGPTLEGDELTKMVKKMVAKEVKKALAGVTDEDHEE